MRIALFSILSGLFLLALFPIYRVVFGHGGRADLLLKRLPFFVVVGALIFFAAISRYVADLAPKARIVHLVAAAVCWIIAVLIWIVRVIPKVTIVQPAE